MHLIPRKKSTLSAARVDASRLLQPLLLARLRGHRTVTDGAQPGSRAGARLRSRGRRGRRDSFVRSRLPRTPRGSRYPAGQGNAARPTEAFSAASRTTSAISFRRFWASFRIRRPDVVVGLTDPPIIGLVAWATARRTGARFVFLCQDIFPEVANLLEDFRSERINWVLERVNRFLVRRADRVIALGETMKRRLVEGKGASPENVAVIHNWADGNLSVARPERQPILPRTRASRSFRGPSRGQHRPLAEPRFHSRRCCRARSGHVPLHRRRREEESRSRTRRLAEASRTSGFFPISRANACGRPTPRATSSSFP